MDWYIVIKTINGRRYRYRQKTWREGGRVRTRSEYIGLAGDEANGSGTRAPPAAMKEAPLLDPVILDEVFTRLTDPTFVCGNFVGEPWDFTRQVNEVQKVEKIERVLSLLNVEIREANLGA